MHKWLFILSFYTFNSFAQELPEHLLELLGKSQEYFEIYNQKSAVEIEDGIYDDSEFLLFLQVDQMNGLDLIFSKEEIKIRACFQSLIG